MRIPRLVDVQTGHSVNILELNQIGLATAAYPLSPSVKGSMADPTIIDYITDFPYAPVPRP